MAWQRSQLVTLVAELEGNLPAETLRVLANLLRVFKVRMSKSDLEILEAALGEIYMRQEKRGR